MDTGCEIGGGGATASILLEVRERDSNNEDGADQNYCLNKCDELEARTWPEPGSRARIGKINQSHLSLCLKDVESAECGGG